MNENNEHQFVDTDAGALLSDLISDYEEITEITVQPASPERLHMQWLAHIMTHERVLNNYTGNQNLPSKANGENLDELGLTLYDDIERPLEQAAISTERFYISEAQNSAILVPAGTRITDVNSILVWETIEDIYIDIGETYADVMIRCQTPGTVGNGYTPGQICSLIDIFPYYDHCENITESDYGANTATDAEYYELLRASKGSYSTAGAEDAYRYYAKRVSTQIADVVVNSLSPGQVNIFVLMDDGTIAGTEIKNAVLAACNRKFIRPLTDYVVVGDAETLSYDIEFTYYISRSATQSASEIEEAVLEAVNEYTSWQSAKLGRDINPDELRQLVKAAGVKRIELVSPNFTTLRDGSDNTVPQLATIGTVSITSGGYEDE